MKIVFISTFLPQRCGIATYTNYLITGMREVNPSLDIKILAESKASSLKEKNFEVIPCWDRNENYVEQIINRAEIKDAGIVHVQHEYSIYKFDDRLPELIKKLNPGGKKLITIHCVRPAQFSERGSVDENYAKKIASLSDAVIVHLESQKAILKRLGIQDKKIHIIPHGTELSDADKKISRRKFSLPEEGRIMLMFGFVKRHKCMHIVLDALKEITKYVKDVYLLVAGGLFPTASQEDKNYVELIYKKMEELSLQRNIIFPNRFFPNEDVPYIYGASDIVLFPYYEEDRSASGSFHLAIGAKKPIIASRIPKFEELKNICDELLILPYNSSAISKIAIRLFEDKEFLRYIQDKTDDYRMRTSWKETAIKHLEIYTSNIVPLK